MKNNASDEIPRIPKKVVHSSNLALRFYRSRGWTEEILRPYLIKGQLMDTHTSHHKDPIEESYFILAVGGVLDMRRLYLEQISAVVRAFNDYPQETDLEFMERYNW